MPTINLKCSISRFAAKFQIIAAHGISLDAPLVAGHIKVLKISLLCLPITYIIPLYIALDEYDFALIKITREDAKEQKQERFEAIQRETPALIQQALKLIESI